MTNKPVIQRYLSSEHLNRAIQDMKPVVKLLNSSYGEFSLQLREDYFNIYYQGNSAAKVQFNAGGTYSAIIHYKFVEEILESLNKYSDIKQTPENRNSNGYCRFRIQPKNLHGFFQRVHLQRLGGNIRKVHNGEEITMEQVIVTDNPPNRNFIIIDRQVADHSNWSRIDLLALKRDPTNKFHFVVIEVKLGRNPELCKKAGEQVSNYVQHIRKNMKGYIDCYQQNYSQKKELGLFNEDMPDSIKINSDLASVEGIVVAIGYSQLAQKNIESLNTAIKRNGWNITVRQMPKMQLS
jgi:hypothetical protein